MKSASVDEIIVGQWSEKEGWDGDRYFSKSFAIPHGTAAEPEKVCGIVVESIRVSPYVSNGSVKWRFSFDGYYGASELSMTESDGHSSSKSAMSAADRQIAARAKAIRSSLISG